ncbi:hypothetical protein GCM10010466_65510 [Planomonospora alba]|uniref:Uncharacterized protein n=1 Tax=Planomonospora alba TaxID=161354 RepID=A0ABP6P3U8_9ACTN
MNETENPAVEPEPVPAETPAPAAPAAEPVDDGQEEERPEGIPAGHLAAGGVSAASALLTGVYQLAGLPGLIGGAVLAGGGAAAYVRHRLQRRRSGRTWGVAWEDGRGGRAGTGGRRSSGGAFGALRSEGRSAGAGRSGRSSGSRSRAGGLLGGRGGRAAGTTRSGGLGGLVGGRAARPSGTGSAGSAAAGRSRADRAAERLARRRRTSSEASAATRSTGRTQGGKRRGPLGKARQTAASTATAARRFGRMTRRAGAATAGATTRAARSVGSRVRQGAARVDAATGGRASRAYRAVGRTARRTVRATGRAAAAQARRAGAWADRKTGRRMSTAWAATRSADGYRAARRRAAATLGGPAGAVAAPLLALLALAVKRWRARQERKATAKATAEATSENSAADSAEDAPDDTHAVTGSTWCPRCRAFIVATIPAGQQKRTVVCEGCGFTLHFVREHNEPDDPPEDEDTSSAPAADRPSGPVITPSRIYRRSPTMSANPLAAAAAEVNSVAAAHAPVDMFQVARELDQLHEVPANVALALRTYTQRLQGEYPINPAVVEAIHQLYAGMAQLVSVAEEIGPLFRQIHADDLRREEAPRTNEQLWNV